VLRYDAAQRRNLPWLERLIIQAKCFRSGYTDRTCYSASLLLVKPSPGDGGKPALDPVTIVIL
jgi:hypothetical protein